MFVLNVFIFYASHEECDVARFNQLNLNSSFSIGLSINWLNWWVTFSHQIESYVFVIMVQAEFSPVNSPLSSPLPGPLVKWVGILQVGIFWVGIFRGGGIFQGGVWWNPRTLRIIWKLYNTRAGFCLEITRHIHCDILYIYIVWKSFCN